MKNTFLTSFFLATVIALLGVQESRAKDKEFREEAVVTFAPNVPPPITRRKSATVIVKLDSKVVEAEITQGVKYKYWTFNGHVPGPFVRTRVGDVLEVHSMNSDMSGMPHNTDFHAVTGPGGGAPVTTVVQGEHRISRFKLLEPGLYLYHCAAPPVMDHIANGMYGLVLVEPKNGLPKVDREYYVMQSEFYTTPVKDDVDHVEYSHENGLAENPTFIVFNGSAGALIGDGALKANVGERVRIYFGNAGPNKISSFHIIGTIFDKVYREGGFVSPPERSLQTTLVPAGGATVVETVMKVPGDYTLVDHAIFRIEKGAVGFLYVEGKPAPEIYWSEDPAVSCEGCKVHP